MPLPPVEAVKEWIGVRHVLAAVRYAEARWFDATRHVRTAGEVPLDALTLLGSADTGHRYAPVRPVAARRLFRALPAIQYEQYTFIDFGSGKGRMLFLAAEHPFREIIGIEFARELHALALYNIARYRSPKQRCHRLTSLAMDAQDYRFPPVPLVVYFYNPFGPAIMHAVLAHLEASLAAAPRDVLLILLFPEVQAPLLASSRRFQPYRQTHHYHIYRSVNSAAATPAPM